MTATTQDTTKPQVFLTGALAKDQYGMIPTSFPSVKVYFTERVQSGASAKTWTLKSSSDATKANSDAATDWSKASKGIMSFTTGFATTATGANSQFHLQWLAEAAA